MTKGAVAAPSEKRNDPRRRGSSRYFLVVFLAAVFLGAAFLAGAAFFIAPS